MRFCSESLEGQSVVSVRSLMIDRFDCRSDLYWPLFLLNAYEERHNARYRGTADLRLHSYQDSSKDAFFCQREKPKIVHTSNKHSTKSRFRVHLPRYK